MYTYNNNIAPLSGLFGTARKFRKFNSRHPFVIKHNQSHKSHNLSIFFQEMLLGKR